MMTPITQSDIERGFSQQSSSSYGSLDLSSAQYPDSPDGSSGNGLSMHINEHTEELVSTTAPSSSAATNAVNATYGAGGFDIDNDDHHNQDNHNGIEIEIEDTSSST